MINVSFKLFLTSKLKIEVWNSPSLSSHPSREANKHNSLATPAKLTGFIKGFWLDKTSRKLKNTSFISKSLLLRLSTTFFLKSLEENISHLNFSLILGMFEGSVSNEPTHANAGYFVACINFISSLNKIVAIFNASISCLRSLCDNFILL